MEWGQVLGGVSVDCKAVMEDGGHGQYKVSSSGHEAVLSLALIIFSDQSFLYQV